MLTTSARRSISADPDNEYETTLTVDDARCATWASARAQIEARRWQRVGRAIVAHNGPLTEGEKWRAALINSGPRAVLTSFTAAQAHGLTGWHRSEIHVLVPGGARVHPVPALNVQVHYASSWDATERVEVRSLHALAPALLVAAGSLAPRPACGLLAAAVQQRRTSAVTLSAALERAPRQKHRRLLIGCCHDIGQGAQALSEIDFVRLCRRFGLPRPIQQMVRVEPTGQRRYLDAAWKLADGRVAAVEVDGAMHLAPQQWYADQIRHNEMVINGTILLRYPSVVVRAEERLVADQLARALQLS